MEDSGAQEVVKSMIAVLMSMHSLTFGGHDWHLSGSPLDTGTNAWSLPLNNKHYLTMMFAMHLPPPQITLLNDLSMVSSQRKRLPLENSNVLQLLVKKFAVHSLSACSL
jgi:hypothetical protein